MFRKNYPLQKDSTLQEIRWYQWENVVNSAGKTWLEKVLKEALIDMYDSLCAQLPSFIAHYYIKQKTKWSLCAKFKRSQRNWFCWCFTDRFFWTFFHFLAEWSTDYPLEQKANYNFFMFLAQRFMWICSCDIWWFTPLQGLNNSFHW